MPDNSFAELAPVDTDALKRAIEKHFVGMTDAEREAVNANAARQRSTKKSAPVTFTPIPAGRFVGEKLTLPHWAVENIWPEGAMGVIGGAPKNGKSSLALELAVSLSTGTPFLGLRDHFPVKTGAVPVLYVQVENSRGRVQRDHFPQSLRD